MFSESCGNVHLVLSNEPNRFGILFDEDPTLRAGLQMLLESSTRSPGQVVFHVVGEKLVHVPTTRIFTESARHEMKEVHPFTGGMKMIEGVPNRLVAPPTVDDGSI